MTIRWITDGDRAEQARIARQRVERNELMSAFGDWLAARAGHHGPIRVPPLSSDTEARLMRLLRPEPGEPTG